MSRFLTLNKHTMKNVISPTLKTSSSEHAQSSAGDGSLKSKLYLAIKSSVTKGLVSVYSICTMSRNKCCRSSQYLFLLPLVTCLAFPITFAISYGYSVHNHNVNSTGDFPYISETGTTAPESCIFGQLLNIAAVISGLTIYIRYRQAQQALDHFLSAGRGKVPNIVSLGVGMTAAFGVSMVGNFQMDNLLIAHYVGAGLAFVLGSVYAWIQCYVSYQLLMFMCTRPMFYFRVVCSMVITIFLIGTLVGAQLYTFSKEQTKSYRLLSTISEWIMALGLAVLFATFSSEFRATKIEKPRISIIQEKLSRV